MTWTGRHYYAPRWLLKLAHAIVADGPLSDEIRACVANIAAKTDETAALAVLSGQSGNSA